MLVRPTAQYFTGDVSRYLPDATWSGADDKEQIIYASAASTIQLPLIASALVFYLYPGLARPAAVNPVTVTSCGRHLPGMAGDWRLAVKLPR